MLKAYAVTGFLGAGKTSLLNGLLKQRLDDGRRIFLLQFESGEQKLAVDRGKRSTLTALAVSKRNWDSRPEEVAAGLRRRLIQAVCADRVDELWIEWNGAAPFAELQALFTKSCNRAEKTEERLYGIAELAGVVTVVDTPRYDAFMAQAENNLPGFLAAADLVVLRGPDQRRVRREISRLLPGTGFFSMPATAGAEAKPLPAEQARQVDQKLTGRKRLVQDRLTFILPVVIMTALLLGYTFFKPRFPGLDRLLTVFLGILMQAIPFLLIGVLISSAVQILLPPGFLTRLFPRGKLSSLLFALLAGFCLPVCDCASIPVFHSLLRKGVPVSAAVTFMVASPIINPIVILSTYHAFGGDWRIVGSRFGLGLIAGLLTGLLMSIGQGRRSAAPGAETDLATAGGAGTLRSDRLMRRCSLSTGISLGPDSSGFDKIHFFCRHAALELFDIIRYLIVAALLSAAVQIFVNLNALPVLTANLPAAVLIMMALAFLLSLCSSSDAVIARSFASSFPPAALMAFLIYGPVMDMKNLIMLSAASRKRFILRLFLTATAIMFLLALVYHYFLLPLLL